MNKEYSILYNINKKLDDDCICHEAMTYGINSVKFGANYAESKDKTIQRT